MIHNNDSESRLTMIETITINDHVVTFDPHHHQYTVDGVNVVSVTQIVDALMPKMYQRVDPEILRIAALRGTELHDMIERFETKGEKTYHVEMQSYLSLKAQHQFQVIDNEKIVLIYDGGQVVAAGRFDMIVKSPYIKGLGIADVKRMAHLNEERLKLQLNLYKLGYEQTYKKKIHYLKCIHIRYQHHQYVDVMVDANYVKTMLRRYLSLNPIHHHPWH